MPRTLLTLLPLALTLALTPALANQPADAPKPTKPSQQPPHPRTPFLENVKTIAAPGVPGSIALWNPNAFIVAVGNDNNRQVPVIAAARAGKGRIVLFGHSSYFNTETLAEADTATLMLNSIRWAAGDRRAPRIGVTGGPDSARPFETIGITVTPQGVTWADKLSNLDVLILSRPLREEDVPALQRFIDSGGGFVTAQTGWGWKQLSGDKNMTEFSVNHVIAPAGLSYTDGYAEKQTPEGFDVTIEPEPLIHGGAALEALLKPDRPVTPDRSPKLTPEQMETASISAIAALRVLPENDTAFRPRLDRLVSQRAEHLVPTERKPLKAKDSPVDRFLLAYQLDQLRELAPQHIKPHPAAATFPGAVPANARKVTRTIQLDTTIPDWHSLGLYASPGIPITLTVSPKAASSRLAIRIGAHSDQLWHHDEWKRIPEISRRWPITAEVAQFATPFGGLIYIEIPENCTLGPADITIANAVEAPLFILDKTTPDQWKLARQAPAPWAELATSKVIVTVPSDRIRNLEDPVSVMKYWDEILDADADLAAISRTRPRPERLTADLQISAGYMHSGYPIMTHLDAAEWMVSLPELRRGNWGLYHELGHNHQHDAWTFDGTGEVTCNLFTLYVHDTVCADDAQTNSKQWLAKHRQGMVLHLEAGAPFDKWKSDPFLALIMYIQLQQDFGWETYKRVFTEYRALSPAELPKSDDEKRDQWMIRFSRACGRNLGPFFQTWGIPTSQAARDQIKNLPEWMPAEWPAR